MGRLRRAMSLGRRWRGRLVQCLHGLVPKLAELPLGERGAPPWAEQVCRIRAALGRRRDEASPRLGAGSLAKWDGLPAVEVVARHGPVSNGAAWVLPRHWDDGPAAEVDRRWSSGTEGYLPPVVIGPLRAPATQRSEKGLKRKADALLEDDGRSGGGVVSQAGGSHQGGLRS